MSKTTALEYKLFLKLYVWDHECLAQDYASMRKVVSLFEACMEPCNTAFLAHLKSIRKRIDKSQHVNHRAQTSIHHRLQSLKSQSTGHVLKRFWASLSCSEVELGAYYLIVQEEEQIHSFLKEQHKQLKSLLQKMYEPSFLDYLSSADLVWVESLELLLRGACYANRGILGNCNLARKNLKNYAPYDIPTTSFQSLMQHCKSWGSKELSIPLRPKSFFTRIRERCADFWQVCVFIVE